MSKAIWRQTMIEMIVRKSLHDIQQDPKRAIRKLVDLGAAVSNGKLQKDFMEMAQNLLADENSPYYELISNTVNEVDHDRLIKFGINLGWNSLTEGAARIQELELQSGHGIPWSITLYMSDIASALSAEQYLRLIRDGTELGIYTYFLVPEDPVSLQKALNLAGSCDDCAFFLIIPDNCQWEQNLQNLILSQNVILGVDFGQSDWELHVQQLKERKYLYFLYRRYSTENDVKHILSGEWIRQTCDKEGLAVAFIGSAVNCTAMPWSQVHQYALETRLKQHPPLVLDFYPDSIYLSQKISNTPYLAAFLPDGILTVYYHGCEMPTRYSAQTTQLKELLQYLRKCNAATSEPASS